MTHRCAGDCSWHHLQRVAWLGCVISAPAPPRSRSPLTARATGGCCIPPAPRQDGPASNGHAAPELASPAALPSTPASQPAAAACCSRGSSRGRPEWQQRQQQQSGSTSCTARGHPRVGQQQQAVQGAHGCERLRAGSIPGTPCEQEGGQGRMQAAVSAAALNSGQQAMAACGHALLALQVVNNAVYASYLQHGGWLLTHPVLAAAAAAAAAAAEAGQSAPAHLSSPAPLHGVPLCHSVNCCCHPHLQPAAASWRQWRGRMMLPAACSQCGPWQRCAFATSHPCGGCASPSRLPASHPNQPGLQACQSLPRFGSAALATCAQPCSVLLPDAQLLTLLPFGSAAKIQAGPAPSPAAAPVPKCRSGDRFAVDMKVVKASAVRFVLEERVMRLPRRPGEEETVGGWVGALAHGSAGVPGGHREQWVCLHT